MKFSISKYIAYASPLLAIIAAFLGLCGVGFWYIHQSMTLLAAVLMWAAVLLGVVLGVSHLRSIVTSFSGRAFVKRVAIVGGVAVSVLALCGANVWARRYDQRLDLTANAQHTLTAQTKACLGRLKEQLQITALYAGAPPDYVRDLLEEVQRNSGGKVKQEIVDPLQNLGYASQFGPRIDGQERRVIIRMTAADGRPARREELNCKEIALSEERITAAIMKMTGGARKAYFVTGHEEYDIDNLKEGGYSDIQLGLAQEGIASGKLLLSGLKKIPADCNVLVIGGARRNFSAEEKATLREYQNRGGSVLFMLEAAVRVPPGESYAGKENLNPSFNEIFADWGMVVGDDVVVDLANHIGQDVGCPATSTYPPHEHIVADLGVTFYIRPRSLTFNQKAKTSVLVAPLVKTMGIDSSWAETDKNLFVRYDKGQDIEGPVTIAAVMMRNPEGHKAGQGSAKMIVIGNAAFATNEFAKRYANRDLVVNAVRWLSDAEPMLNADRSRSEPPRLEVTSKDLRRAQVIMGLSPFLVMSVGILVWWRRNGTKMR